MTSPIPPISAHSMLVLLLQLGLLLGLALGLGRVAVRLHMPAVVGELAAGVLIGPSLLAHLAPALSTWLFPHVAAQQHLLDAIGQLGVLLLVGITGMSIDLKLVRRTASTGALVGIGGLVVPLVLGVALGFVLPAFLLTHGTHRIVFASFIGVAMCVSAIPVIAKTLLEMRLLHRDIGQLIMSAATLSDIVGWLLLSLVSALATTGLRTGHVVLSVVSLVAVLVLTVVIGRPVVNTALRLSAKSEQPRVSVATAVALLLLAAAGCQALGMEPVLGTLLCGLLIGSSRWVDRERLAPVRTLVMGVLAPIYFATAGLRMDLTQLGRPAVLASAFAVLVLAIVGKFAGAYAGARTAKLDHWKGLAVGAGLNARGVIEVIVATVGLQLGVLNTATYTIIVLVAIVTSLMAPPLLRYATSRIAVNDEEREREKVLGE
jgi:Kef-type K+ transport system membrane component KefB